MLNSLINLFYPKVCCGCDAILLLHEQVICTTCRHEIPLTGHFLDPENEAMKKFYGKVSIEFAAAFVYFHKKSVVQQLIHNLKYKGHEEIGALMGHWSSSLLAAVIEKHRIQVIIPVPLHPKKMRQRGYNQVAEFAKALAADTKLEYNGHLLVRKIHSKTQTRKNLLSRAEVGAQSVFDVNSLESDCNTHFLLVDDVLTTGATLESCARALLKIPGSKVSIFCIAMTQ